jgi:hypothetical protein
MRGTRRGEAVRCRVVLVGLAALLPLLALPAPPAQAGLGCNPYPVGRCGAYDREDVVFCWDPQVFARNGTYVTGTDADVVAVGTWGLPPLPLPLPPLAGVDVQGALAGANVLYVRLAPAQALLAAPLTAPLPLGSAWRETNGVPGLQERALDCGTFTWYAECQAWMGPYGTLRVPADAALA